MKLTQDWVPGKSPLSSTATRSSDACQRSEERRKRQLQA